MTDLDLIRENLKHYRVKAGLTQKETAEKSGLSPTYIYLLESGRKTPSFPTLEAICAVIGVRIKDLFISHEEM